MFILRPFSYSPEDKFADEYIVSIFKFLVQNFEYFFGVTFPLSVWMSIITTSCFKKKKKSKL